MSSREILWWRLSIVHLRVFAHEATEDGVICAGSVLVETELGVVFSPSEEKTPRATEACYHKPLDAPLK